jgi:O-antigen ligase
VISLIAPATFWLYLRDRGNILWPVTGLAAATAALHFTSSRSPLVMILLTAGLALSVAFTRRRALLLWSGLLLVAVPLLVFVGPPGGWVRWTDTGDTLVNVSDRLLSNLSTLDLALRHPFGMGVDGGRRALFEDTGIQATHNAWLQAALVFGIPLALAIAAGFLTDLLRIRRGWRSDAFWPGLLAFHLTGLFFFEEHLNNPTFVILAMWLVTEAVRQGAASARVQSRSSP